MREHPNSADVNAEALNWTPYDTKSTYGPRTEHHTIKYYTTRTSGGSLVKKEFIRPVNEDTYRVYPRLKSAPEVTGDKDADSCLHLASIKFYDLALDQTTVLCACCGAPVEE
jgi:hypothetical protein